MIPAAPAAPPAVAAQPSSPPSAACKGPEHRQLDFWIGEWDLVIRQRKAPESSEWDEAKGRNHIQAILGGCAVEESFTGEGPGAPWAGRSLSMYRPEGRWRQTWVDDGGDYLAFTGGMKDGKMILTGEPREKEGKTVMMRMVFSDITPEHLSWSWDRSVDAGATWTPIMTIGYTRRR